MGLLLATVLKDLRWPRKEPPTSQGSVPLPPTGGAAADHGTEKLSLVRGLNALHHRVVVRIQSFALAEITFPFPFKF